MAEAQSLGPSEWMFPGIEGPDPYPPADCVAGGADLAPATIVEAYRAGLFPMGHASESGEGPPLWWSPLVRGVLWPGDLRVSRSLRRSVRRFSTSVDTAFADVIDACADPDRPGAWIDPQIRDAYVELHRLGWAHSVEVWEHGELVGGLYGLAIGALFAGESMFHRATDASKVALVELCRRMAGGVIDVQWSTSHLASLGVTQMPRAEYRRVVAEHRDGVISTPWS